ncbi:MAG TPA: AMP-binding protein [Burkholderiaceae bacterium]|nr:AMP-binding protein [Burkholderiaceae bacterium]
MTAGDPLFARSALSRTLAWRDGRPIGVQRFLAQAAALAERLPAEGQPVNLCSDRYLFLLGFVAGLMRGQMSLLPPNAMPQTLRQVAQPGATPYALVDDALQDTGGLHAIALSHDDAAPAVDAAAQIPMFHPELWSACLLTSGSTGVPQPQQRRWRALTLSIEAERRSLAHLLDWPTIDGLNIVATVPAQHSYGFESSVLLALLGGAAFDVGRPFYPADIAEALDRLPRPRALATTPVHLKALLGSGLGALPAVDLVLSATAPLSPQMAQQAEQALGGRTLEIYGCTEAGQVAARRTTAGEVWTTLGDLRLHVEHSGDGERFIVSGGHVLQPTPLADLLELIDAQHFRLLGRANDLIHVAGKRSSLAHLNFHLNRIAGVQDGAFWLPDDVPEGVVRLVAFVVAPTLSARQITDALRREVEAAFVPRRVVHVDRLPREATGKLTTQRLREFALQTLARVGSGTSRR